MENELTPELLEKAKQAKSPEELVALAKENGVALSDEQANAYFAKLNPKVGELADDELDQVAGGCGDEEDTRPVVKPTDSCNDWHCDFCGSIWYNNLFSIEGSCGHRCGTKKVCKDCQYKVEENGQYFCTHPNHKK